MPALRTTRDGDASNLERGPRFDRLTVVATSAKGTRAALDEADRLASGLRLKIDLVVVGAVPYHASLKRPPVAPDFLKRAWMEAAAGRQSPIRVRAFLCRRPEPVLEMVIPPGSLVLVGAGSRWWPWRERRLVRLLQRRGHDVVLVGSGGRAASKAVGDASTRPLPGPTRFADRGSAT